MLRHVVLFRWTEQASQEAIETIAGDLSRLPGAIAEILDYRFGPDAGIHRSADVANWDYAVSADFASVDDFATYRDHPAHLALIGRIAPLLADRAAVQFEVD
jgi:hypothetical protein